MVGRDICTVVLPDADLKLYVTASAEERARRRYLDRLAQGDPESHGSVLKNLRRRDQIDSTRAAAPLRPAEDALYFDNTQLSIEGMFAAIDRILGREEGSATIRQTNRC